MKQQRTQKSVTARIPSRPPAQSPTDHTVGSQISQLVMRILRQMAIDSLCSRRKHVCFWTGRNFHSKGSKQYCYTSHLLISHTSSSNTAIRGSAIGPPRNYFTSPSDTATGLLLSSLSAPSRSIPPTNHFLVPNFLFPSPSRKRCRR